MNAPRARTTRSSSGGRAAHHEVRIRSRVRDVRQRPFRHVRKSTEVRCESDTLTPSIDLSLLAAMRTASRACRAAWKSTPTTRTAGGAPRRRSRTSTRRGPRAREARHRAPTLPRRTRSFPGWRRSARRTSGRRGWRRGPGAGLRAGGPARARTRARTRAPAAWKGKPPPWELGGETGGDSDGSSALYFSEPDSGGAPRRLFHSVHGANQFTPGGTLVIHPPGASGRSSEEFSPTDAGSDGSLIPTGQSKRRRRRRLSSGNSCSWGARCLSRR